jgi:hypothetical protein
MARELNPPEEIIRRLIFVIYISSWVGFIITGTVGLLQSRTGLLVTAILLLGASILLKSFGERHLEFRRLAKSFPDGSRKDEIPIEIRREVENLFRRFSETTDWQERQEIRLQLSNLVKKESLLLEVYEENIDTVHSSLLR